MFFITSASYSQDITGLWKGTINTSGSSLYYELVINNEGTKLNGYALTVYIDKGVENIGIKTAELKKKGNKIIFEDDKLVYNNYTTPPKRMKLFATLVLTMDGELMKLNGTFNTRSLDMRYSETFSGTINLEKTAKADSSKLVAKLNELEKAISAAIAMTPEQKFENKKVIIESTAGIGIDKITAASEQKVKKSNAENQSIKLDSTGKIDKSIVAVEQQKKKETVPTQNGNQTFSTTKSNTTPSKILLPPAAELTMRKIEVINNITFSSDSLILNLYDNGEIDGDTVSIVLNGKVILPQQGLTANATKYVLKITPDMGDTLSLIMYAENLGRIHPNTGLLILLDGSNKHEIRFSGDLQKSPLIRLRRRK